MRQIFAAKMTARVFRDGRSQPAEPEPEPERTEVMSLHDTLLRVALVEDDELANALALALNFDQDVRALTKQVMRWDAAAVRRVARAIADHSNLSAYVPRPVERLDAEIAAAARQAVGEIEG